MVNSCYVWGLTTSNIIKTSADTSHSVSETASNTDLQETAIVMSTTHYTEDSITYFNVSNVITEENGSVLALAISTGVGFMLCVTLLTFIIVARKRVIISSQLDPPPIPNFPRDLEMDFDLERFGK